MSWFQLDPENLADRAAGREAPSLGGSLGIGTLGFTVVSVAHPGSVAGLLAGTIAMGWMFAVAFDARAQAFKVIAALFVLNSAGYFAGGWMEGYLVALPKFAIGGVMLTRSTQVMVAMLEWGVCYGMGLGAGLGLAFYFCQTKARALLTSRT